MLRDGGTENSPLMDTFCTDKPPTQKSTDNTMYVKYFTNSPNPNNGFKANARIGKIYQQKSFYQFCIKA
jgi:hypothetical protein